MEDVRSTVVMRVSLAILLHALDELLWLISGSRVDGLYSMHELVCLLLRADCAHEFESYV